MYDKVPLERYSWQRTICSRTDAKVLRRSQAQSGRGGDDPGVRKGRLDAIVEGGKIRYATVRSRSDPHYRREAADKGPTPYVDDGWDAARAQREKIDQVHHHQEVRLHDYVGRDKDTRMASLNFPRRREGQTRRRFTAAAVVEQTDRDDDRRRRSRWRRGCRTRPRVRRRNGLEAEKAPEPLAE